jgi:hypothetical protein
MKVRTFKVFSTDFQLVFQKDQWGATLRASDVKARLDRFIFNKLGEHNNYNKGVSIASANKWLINNAPHPALDYKMRIVRQVNTDQNKTEAQIILTIRNDALSNFINNDLMSQFFEDNKIRFGKGKTKGVGKFALQQE